MIDRPPRRFTIADGMILTAAFAAGLAQHLGRNGPRYLKVEHWYEAPIDFRPGVSYSQSYVMYDWKNLGVTSWYKVQIAIPFLAMATLATLAIRWRRPRPGRRRSFRQPGMVAMLAATAVMAFNAIAVSIQLGLCATGWSIYLAERKYCLSPAFVAVTVESPETIAVAIASAWAILGLSGRWRAEPGWIDRTGRAIGVGWLVIALAEWWAWRLG